MTNAATSATTAAGELEVERRSHQRGDHRIATAATATAGEVERRARRPAPPPRPAASW